MKVIALSMHGVTPAVPTEYLISKSRLSPNPRESKAWQFVIGEPSQIQGDEHRFQVRIPIGNKDFPYDGPQSCPGPDTEYFLLNIDRSAARTEPNIPEKTVHKHTVRSIIPRFMLVKHKQPDQEAKQYLVLWSLTPAYEGSATYGISGAAQYITEGRQAYGDAGQFGSAPCPIVKVTGPCVLSWSRVGGKEDNRPRSFTATCDEMGEWKLKHEKAVVA